MTKKRVGKVTTVNAQTDEVVSEKRNAMTLLPPAPDKCQVCASDHAWDQPHNQQSLYYRMAFRAMHGRYPTWADAMAHCANEVKQQWREHLVALMREKGMEIPADLLEASHD